MTPDLPERTDTTSGRGSIGLELLASSVVAILYFGACWTIRVHPLERLGQVSALAGTSWRYLCFAVPMLAALVLVLRWRPARFPLALSLVCAGIAGMCGAAVAGNVAAALQGTPYGLGGTDGDVGVLARWASLVQSGGTPPSLYPPLQVYLLAWIGDLRGVSAAYAVKSLQLVGLIAFGPLVYASWRLVLNPIWAVGIGITASLVLIDPYRVYPLLVLAVFVPLVIRFLQELRWSEHVSYGGLARRGALFGGAFGVLFLLYSGWYQWSAPGILIAIAIVFPWRNAPRRGALLCGVAGLVFAVISFRYLLGVAAAPPIKDGFIYFDVLTEPSYIAMWRGDLPGEDAALWPPRGELGGVGIFTVLLTVGFGSSVMLGRKHTLVIGATWMMIGAWLFRYGYASQMGRTGFVQLYPRTSAEILYLLLVLSGFAVYLATRRWWPQASGGDEPISRDGPIGALCGLGLLYLFATSALADPYMPDEHLSARGNLALLAHRTPPLAGDFAKIGVLVASSVSPDGEHGVAMATDGQPSTWFSSAVAARDDEEAWAQLDFKVKVDVSRVKLTPAPDGFPNVVHVEVWNGVQWVERVSKAANPSSGQPVELTWEPRDVTNRMRIRASKLGAVPGGYALRLGEIEVYR